MIKLKLKDLITENKMTISDLSRKTGVSRTSLTPLINNPESITAIQFKTLNQICKVLNVSTGDILEYIDEDANFEFINIDQLSSNKHILTYQLNNGFETVGIHFLVTQIRNQFSTIQFLEIDTSLALNALYDDNLAFRKEKNEEAMMFLTHEFNSSFMENIGRNIINVLVNKNLIEEDTMPIQTIQLVWKSANTNSITINL